MAPVDDFLEVFHKKMSGGEQNISDLDYLKWELEKKTTLQA